jgi:hypothetical protein
VLESSIRSIKNRELKSEYQGIEFPDTRFKLPNTQREIGSDPRVGFISTGVMSVLVSNSGHLLSAE